MIHFRQIWLGRDHPRCSRISFSRENPGGLSGEPRFKIQMLRPTKHRIIQGKPIDSAEDRQMKSFNFLSAVIFIVFATLGSANIMIRSRKAGKEAVSDIEMGIKSSGKLKVDGDSNFEVEPKIHTKKLFQRNEKIKLSESKSYEHIYTPSSLLVSLWTYITNGNVNEVGFHFPKRMNLSRAFYTAEYQGWGDDLHQSIFSFISSMKGRLCSVFNFVEWEKEIVSNFSDGVKVLHGAIEYQDGSGLHFLDKFQYYLRDKEILIHNCMSETLWASPCFCQIPYSLTSECMMVDSADFAHKNMKDLVKVVISTEKDGKDETNAVFAATFKFYPMTSVKIHSIQILANNFCFCELPPECHSILKGLC
ncbi:hypothetical protein CROQUDRAFT_676217 [Cronartium quercuum f. sp. fusiforme G11]|uniref:Uncharacterized protein n=1 Tax=Cronartium quercuum f. sp. fusiforme G11 TaxID=708437 RepID=A0A9P6NSF0_9BASI|nr:hypothetical protein CROQUDRAFT_676217 [Cronartium quercuum f. sp. fusiforme G11]